jgi:hypothetical protein
MRGRYTEDDLRGGYGPDDARGRYGQDDPGDGYGPDDTLSRYAQDAARGYGPDDTLGRYAQGAARGSYGLDDMRGQFSPAEASAFEREFADRERGPAGPLSSVPSSRYGARS